MIFRDFKEFLSEFNAHAVKCMRSRRKSLVICYRLESLALYES